MQVKYIYIFIFIAIICLLSENNFKMWFLCKLHHKTVPCNPLPGGGGGYTVLPLSFHPYVRPRYFSSHFSQQLSMTQIWYLVTSFISVPHIVESVFGPIRFLLPVCWLGWFLYTLNIYAHFSSHFSQQLLMAQIWYLVTSFI